MKYIKTVHKDRVVEYPNRYKDQNNNIITLTQEPGHIVEEGTLIDAEKLNKIEDELERLSEAEPDLTGYSKFIEAANDEEARDLSLANPENFYYTLDKEDAAPVGGTNGTS